MRNWVLVQGLNISCHTTETIFVTIDLLLGESVSMSLHGWEAEGSIKTAIHESPARRRQRALSSRFPFGPRGSHSWLLNNGPVGGNPISPPQGLEGACWLGYGFFVVEDMKDAESILRKASGPQKTKSRLQAHLAQPVCSKSDI